MEKELLQKSIHEIAPKLKNREISAHELARFQIERIESLDSKLGAYLHICKEKALTQAKAIDEKIAKGNYTGPLMGIPLGPKDIYLTEGIPTTCASKILEGYVPPYNSTVIQKLLESGMVIVGKINMDEFAMGSSNENSAYKQVKNPWNLDCVPGGSSGGSAAAVSADLCFASLGTDTGGSIRQPASLCSIVGLKPTYGRVSRYGVIAFASSLDQMGPMTKDVEDCALLMNAIAGYDARDSTSIDMSIPDYTSFLRKPVKGLKIGMPREYFAEGIHPSVRDAVQKAVASLEKMGAIVSEVSLPNTEYACAVYYILAPAEASSNLARFDGVRYGLRAKATTLHELYENTKTQGFGPEVKRRIMLGTYVLSAGYYDAYYLKAQKARTLIRNDFLEVFKKVDVLATPTAPTTAFKLGEKTSDPVCMYLSDICTIPVNLAGLPGMSLPCGFDDKNLPIGLQLIGKPFDEGTLFTVAHAYEQAHSWHLKKPSL
ncbi:MAG: aspartyl/glutamyl-tRNA amidotransferase subunit A [Deltaproteobacteria bacterium GWA2_45_12]|nr:MAG: aspartyl/glutamyl-tRNA amidotransferase subunit A [Deltaproteobacteria bacterium GWA2_45_12]